MLAQEIIQDLEQYIIFHYRPEGAKKKAFDKGGERTSAQLSAGGLFPFAACALPFDMLKKIESLVSKMEMSFSEKLMWWIKERKCKPVDIYRDVGITRAHFAKIRNNVQYHPTKETVLAFVVALHLSMDEAVDLLKRAGYALSPSCLGDVIVAYFLEVKRYNIDEINLALYRYNCRPLTNWRECK